MKMRQRRKPFWFFRAVQDFGGTVIADIFMRAHMRKVKPPRQHRWARAALEKTT